MPSRLHHIQDGHRILTVTMKAVYRFHVRWAYQKYGGPVVSALFFFGALFVWHPFVLAQERKKEPTPAWREDRRAQERKKERSDEYVEKAGP